MKTALIVLSLSLLVACSPEAPRDSVGRKERSLAEVCINGVVYYSHWSPHHTSYAPKFNTDSTVETCE